MAHATNGLRGRRRDTAGVIAAPPLLFGAALIVALSLHAIHPIRMARLPGGIPRLAGATLIVVGIAFSIAVVREFRRAGTQLSPYRESTSFVCTGPYRYTRNPDYLGQTLLYVGIALVANSWWPLFFLPFALVVVQNGVIRREERYLEARFGEEYREYMTRVPRWL